MDPGRSGAREQKAHGRILQGKEAKDSSLLAAVRNEMVQRLIVVLGGEIERVEHGRKERPCKGQG